MTRKSLIIFVLSFSLFTFFLMSQELPFSEILKVETELTSGNLGVRTVESLGFRYTGSKKN